MAAGQNAIDRSGKASQSIWAAWDKAQVRALKDAIHDVGPAARREMRVQLKRVGTIVQTEIKRRTPVFRGSYGGQGRSRIAANPFGKKGARTLNHRPGLLRDSTKLRIGSLRVTVYNDARAAYKGGWYRYGKRLEFDKNISTKAFFYPGWDAKRAEAERAFGEVLTAARKAYLK